VNIRVLLVWPSALGLLTLCLIAPRRVSAQDLPPQPPAVLSDEGLLRKYVWSTIGTEGALDATLWSTFQQWRGHPPEWHKDVGGFVQRWSSDYAASAIGNTTKYGVARLLHHDPSFTRCECSGVGARLRHALGGPLTARTRGARRVFSPAIVAGLAAQNIVPAATWYPAPHGARDGVVHVASGIVSKMAVDVFREFVHFREEHGPRGHTRSAS